MRILPVRWQARGALERIVSERHYVTGFCVVMSVRSVCLPPPTIGVGMVGISRPRKKTEEVF